MSRPTTDLGVINLALRSLGESSISSRSEQGKKARNMDDMYEHVIEKGLSSFGWSFAKKRQALALETTDPLYEWTYRWAKPGDVVTILQVSEKKDLDLTLYKPKVTTAWAAEGDEIYTNFADAYILYTYRNETVSSWPGYFVDFVQFSLAKATCIAITGDFNKLQAMAQQQRAAWAEAIAADRMQRTDNKTPENRYVAARGN